MADSDQEPVDEVGLQRFKKNLRASSLSRPIDEVIADVEQSHQDGTGRRHLETFEQ